MDPVIGVISFTISYLVGSISFARVIVKLWTGKDVTEFEVEVEGTDDKYKALSIGGNTVSTVLGAKGGMTVGILDTRVPEAQAVTGRDCQGAVPLIRLSEFRH